MYLQRILSNIDHKVLAKTRPEKVVVLHVIMVSYNRYAANVAGFLRELEA